MRQLLGILILLLLVSVSFASVKVLERSEGQILLEFRLEDYALTEQDGFIRIDVAGFDYASQPGAPLIPYQELKVGLPPAGGMSARVLNSTNQTIRLQNRLLPVPEVRMGAQLSEYHYLVDEELYRAEPQPLLSELPAGSFRGYSFVPLLLHPFAYDGNSELVITTQALIAVSLSGDLSFRALPEQDDLAELFLAKLVNSEQAKQWRNELRSPVNFAAFSQSDHWLRLETDKEGMYRITPSQLSGFPVADIDPRSFRLFSTGGDLLPFQIVTPGPEFKEVPIRVVGEEDGSFDSADYIVFYGGSRDGVSKHQGLTLTPTHYNPYSQNNVYWLTFGGSFSSPVQRMPVLPLTGDHVMQTSTHREQARLETETHRRSLIGFGWFMTRMFSNSTAEYEFQIPLSDVDTSQPQLLSFMMQQEDINSDIYHNINVFVNNIPVEDASGGTVFTWRGTGTYTFQRNVSGFVSGNNTVRIRVIRTGTDNLFLDYITVDYYRLLHKSAVQYSVNQPVLAYDQNIRYNFTGNANTSIYRVNSFSDVAMVPLQTTDNGFYFVAPGIAGTRFLLSSSTELFSPVNITNVVPEDLTAFPTAVDNIIITTDEFLSQAQNLAQMYQQLMNRQSKVVKQSAIFDQFNGGHPDPAALRQFIRYVYHHYPTPRLSSVTLLGLGTTDWRNFSGQAASRNKIMAYQRNQIASDDYFVMISNSFYPEVAIGRYPVRNSNELNNMLSNFQRYTAERQPGWWRNSMVFLGDDLFNGSQTSYENLHTQQTQSAAAVVNPSILVDKIFAWEYEYDEFQNKPGARDDMIAAINEGRLVWYYIGHGSYDKLGAEDYFNGASDMGRFANPDKLPFFMAASCKVTHFDYWGFDSLGQKVVLLNNLGAIASYSASRMSAPYNNAPMMELLLKSLANQRNPVGYAIMDAKIQYTGSNDNDATYILMGDPLLRIIPPVRDSVMTVQGFTPGNREPLRARQQAVVNGSFDPTTIDGIAEIRVFNTETSYNLDWQTLVSHRGSTLFKGSISVAGGEYSAAFIVPDDVSTGNSGKIVSYIWDEAARQDYTNYFHPLPLSDEAVAVQNPDAPRIEIFLASLDFRPGDTVGTNPTLYAKISDSNGINITGSAGHNILLIIDNSLQPIPVTGYFSYNTDSFTEGLLVYPLSNLSEGPHTVQIVAFDNFNLPAVASTQFMVKKSGELSLERFLIYPNPMQRDTNFTFLLSQDSDLEIGIFTVSGRKIHSFKALGRQGFNSIAWNGKDGRGDRLANNTYFVKVTARSGNRKAEKTERLVIYN